MYQFTGIFIAETVHASVRHIFGPFQSIGGALGNFLVYTMTGFLPWRLCKLVVGLGVALPAAFAVVLCKESPYWLVKKGRMDEARYAKIIT